MIIPGWALTGLGLMMFQFKGINNGSDVHGNHKLPDGYRWVIPSPRLCFRLVEALKDRNETKIAQSASLLKMVISTSQLILSSITIYRTQGSQLDRYGYAAFGLSVIPYTFMSFLNLVCIGCMGDYSYLFMLQTPMLQEAKGRPGALICGEVGILQTPHQGSQNNGEQGRLAGTSNDEQLFSQIVQLWTEADREPLCVKMGNSNMKRFKLVSNVKDATFVFHVDAIENRLRICKPKAVGGSDERRFGPPFPSLWSRIRQPLHSSCQFLELTGLAFKLLTACSSPILAIVLPYSLISLLTGFQKRESTVLQRLVMISWIVTSQLAMIFGAVFIINLSNTSLFSVCFRGKITKTITNAEESTTTANAGYNPSLHFWRMFWLPFMALAAIPFWGIGLGICVFFFGAPIAGLVVVGKMLHSCS